MPEVQRYGSIAFPDFESGVGFLYAITQAGDVPASVRLVDNDQLAFAQALKPAGRRRDIPRRWAQRQVLEHWHRFDLEQVAAATVVYEGTEEEVERQQKRVRELAQDFRGIDSGSSRGADGYRLTFAIAYIRDYMLEHWVWGESFETSVSWRNALPMIRAIKQAIWERHADLGLPGQPFVTSRISQIYAEGVCTYFYVGFVYKGVEDPSAAWHALESAARAAMVAHGAAVSHHHGIGQIRTPWLHQTEDDGRTKLWIGNLIRVNQRPPASLSRTAPIHWRLVEMDGTIQVDSSHSIVEARVEERRQRRLARPTPLDCPPLRGTMNTCSKT